MDQPLGRAVGNGVELAESIACLRGEGGAGAEDLMDVTYALGAEMLLVGGLTRDVDDGRARIEAAIASGAAAERFARMVALLGGPGDLMERPDAHLAAAPHVVPAHPTEAGFVSAIATREVGLAVVELGGGRARATDTIDPDVGLTHLAGIGDHVGPERPLALVHARNPEAAARAVERLRAAYRLSPTGAEPGPVILERITA